MKYFDLCPLQSDDEDDEGRKPMVFEELMASDSLTKFDRIDRYMKMEPYKLPVFIMDENKLDKEIWKNIPFAVQKTFSALYRCQENTSRLLHLVLKDTKKRCRL